jgi:hypothetical protein
MPLYFLELTMTTHAVVVADDEAHAYDVAEQNAKRAFDDDCSATPRISLNAEVRNASTLKHGWDGDCLPYGGDGNTNISAMLAAPKEA